VIGAQLVGTVLDAQGKPVAKAAVSITHQERNWSSSASCDSSGKFALLGIPSGLYAVSANHQAQASPRESVDVGVDQRVEIVLRLDDSSIAGIVVDSHGEGVAGVIVSARPVASPRELGPYDTTDSQGRFDFGGLPPGEYELEVYRPEQQNRDLRGTDVKTGNRNVRLTLPSLTVLKGRVLQDGKPVPYFGVAVAEPAEWQWRQAFPTAVRAADGRFSIPNVSTGAHAVVISGPGFTRTLIEAQVTEGQTYDLGDINVQRGQRVTGRVLDGDRKPVSGALVRVNQISSVMIGDDDDNDKLTLHAAQQGTVKAVTTADGTFVLEDLSPPTQEPGRPRTPNQIRASHPSRGIAPPRDLPETATTIDLVLEQAGGIDGRITGEPSDHDWITAYRTGGTANDHSSADIRDRKFRFDKLPPGEYLLVPTRNGGNEFNLAPTSVRVTSNQRTSIEIIIPKTVTVAVEAASECRMILVLRSRPDDTQIVAAGKQCQASRAALPGVEPGTYKFCVDGLTRCTAATIGTAPARQTVKVP
jgi:protocatechuate 3,4-dioxygenase beta subunit